MVTWGEQRINLIGLLAWQVVHMTDTTQGRKT